MNTPISKQKVPWLIKALVAYYWFGFFVLFVEVVHLYAVNIPGGLARDTFYDNISLKLILTGFIIIFGIILAFISRALLQLKIWSYQLLMGLATIEIVFGITRQNGESIIANLFVISVLWYNRRHFSK